MNYSNVPRGGRGGGRDRSFGGGDRGSFGGGDRSFNRGGNENNTPSDTLMVRSLPYSADKDRLQELFPTANDIRIPFDRETDRIKG